MIYGFISWDAFLGIKLVGQSVVFIYHVPLIQLSLKERLSNSIFWYIHFWSSFLMINEMNSYVLCANK